MTSANEPMEAGAEMDRAIAEQVMGWKLLDRRAMGWGDGPIVWSTGQDPDEPNSSPTRQYFSPSSDIAAAFLVVEKMRERGWSVWMIGDDGDWDVIFTCAPPTPVRWCNGSTPPLAICRAAIAACGAGKGKP